MNLRLVRVSVPVLMSVVFQLGSCHNSRTENGLMNLFYGGASGQRSMAPVAAPQQTVHQRDVQAPEVNTERQIERLNREVAALRMALPNRYPPVYGYNYPRGYGYNYPDGVNSAEFNQHLDGASSSQRVPTNPADQFISNLKNARAVEQKKNEGMARAVMEAEYQVVCGLVDNAMKNLSDFLEGRSNESLDEISRGRTREAVADILKMVLESETRGLGKFKEDFPEKIKSKEEKSQGLLAKLEDVRSKWPKEEELENPQEGEASSSVSSFENGSILKQSLNLGENQGELRKTEISDSGKASFESVKGKSVVEENGEEKEEILQGGRGFDPSSVNESEDASKQEDVRSKWSKEEELENPQEGEASSSVSSFENGSILKQSLNLGENQGELRKTEISDSERASLEEIEANDEKVILPGNAESGEVENTQSADESESSSVSLLQRLFRLSR